MALIGSSYGSRTSIVVDSKKSEYDCRMIYAGVPSPFWVRGLEDGHVPSFCLQLLGD